MKKKGIWIAFEGNDGSGKTTQLKKVAEHLRNLGHFVVETREPGGNPYSEEIRSLLFRDEISDDPKTQLLLFTAARRRNILNVVLPAIDSGKIVISDRSELSTYAYQHFQYGLLLKQVKEINDFSTDNVKPDLFILLDVDIKAAKQRMKKAKGNKANHFDKAGKDCWLKRKKGYLAMAKTNKNIILIDANKNTEEVFNQIIEEITKSKLIKKL